MLKYLELRTRSDYMSTPINLHRSLGVTQAPPTITQQAFEGDEGHLRRLARLCPGEHADANDLWAYLHDLRHTPIQDALFIYVLPFLLEAWREDLLGTEGFGGVVEHLYPVLADQRIVDSHLSENQREVVSHFLRETILEEIDQQRGLAFKGANVRPYRWFGAVTTYGVLRPDLGRLWKAWWTIDTVGRAVAAVQYISCLMYEEKDNSIFAPWTPEHGGGPPCLWEFQGHLYSHRWLEPNVSYLTETLTVKTVQDVLEGAVRRLNGQPEYEAALVVREDFPLCIETIKTRCAELPEFLSTVQQSHSLHSWSV